MSSGLRIRDDQGPQPIKIYLLLDQLKKRKIAQKHFAERLGITSDVLTGRAGVFPADKVDECMRLLETWDGPVATTESSRGGRKTVEHPWNGPAFANGKRL